MVTGKGPFCPNCGTKNSATATVCVSCGEPLESWPARDDTHTPPSRPTSDPSLQETTAIRPTGRFTPPAPRRADPPPPLAPPPTRPVESWSPPPPVAPPPVAPPPVAPVAPAAARRRAGPGGCVLGALAILMICVVAAGLAWIVGRPFVSDAIRDELEEGVAIQLADVERLPIQPSGDLVVTDDQINRDLRQYARSYDPIEDPRVTFSPGEIAVSFELYGSRSTYRAGLAVEDGRLVVVDPDVDGSAGQFLDADDLAAVVENQFAALMTLSNVRPTAVRVRAGEITIATEPD